MVSGAVKAEMLPDRSTARTIPSYMPRLSGGKIVVLLVPSTASKSLVPGTPGTLGGSNSVFAGVAAVTALLTTEVLPEESTATIVNV